MKRNNMLSVTVLIGLAAVLILTPLSFAGGEVTLVGQLNNSGKGIVDDAGKQFTIIPSEDIFRDLIALDGQRVELTGVLYVSHGKNMITALSFKILK